jgi:hypothetical protein
MVSINGVVQRANTGTSAPAEGFALVDSNTIIFGANLASGDSVFIVQSGSALTINAPGDNTVATATIQNGAVTEAKIADDAVTADKLANSINTEIAANTAKNTNVTTNLSVTANGTSLTVASSDGTDASIPAVTTSAWGAMTDEDKTKLDGIATSATANVGDAVLANDQTWTGAQRGTVTALTDGATIAVDFNSSNNFSVTLGGNRTLGQPSNQVVGQSGSIFVTQDGTGSRTLAYHADWKWAGGTAPTLTTTAAAVDRIDYIVAAANKIHAVATLAVA